MNEKLLAFDIWGEYGYFRRGYTATSTVSYPFPSRTTIAGLVSSILGLERDSYHDIFSKENSKIGVNILNPIKKSRFNLNYINTKFGFFLCDINPKQGLRTQVQAEFLKDPKFRIYVSLNDSNLMGSLLELISNHKSVYTPYFGISECLTDFKLVEDGFLDVEKKIGENVDIDSVILKNESNIIIESNKKYGSIKSPGFMNSERVVNEYLEYYFEERGNSIKIDKGEYYRIGDDNVILF
ncbi:MAG: type I-B CRISPR-associated protein Cas5b [archaeon]|nr:type I-B CRISPR-associated protein Cas5b [archaeon]